ncbi:MAG: RND transporter [Mariprofundus sp.]
MAWLEEIPYLVVIGIAALMALLPFGAESHLLEKLQMLADGSLTRPIDIFDLLWHSFPTLLLLVKLWLDYRKKTDQHA